MALQEVSVEKTYLALKPKLEQISPDAEIRIKAELVYEINRLKEERGAVILGHNYMEPAVYHGVADIVGDSLQLSKAAAQTDKKIIVFCGVRFMAQTAKVLNPERTVLLPSSHGGCSLASSLTGDQVRALKAKYPGVPVVVYINTYSEVQAEADAVCTSSNAAKVVSSFDTDTVIFLPDEYLARNVAAETGKNIIFMDSPSSPKSDKSLIVGWHGKCEVHEQFSVEDINSARAQFPDVQVLAHPECPPEVVEKSDFSGSTSKMIEHVKKSPSGNFLLLTECSMGDNIIAEAPGKNILRLCNVRCPHMNEITLEEVRNSLRFTQHVIEVDEKTRERAKRALDRMLIVQ